VPRHISRFNGGAGNWMDQLRLLTFGGLNLLVGGYTMTGAVTGRRRLAS